MKKILTFCVTLFLLFIISVSTSQATLPCIVVYDHWYTTKLVIPESALPQGISMVSVRPESVDELQQEELENKNPEPFYVLGKNPDNRTFPGSELPDGYEPKYKIVSNNYYYYDISPEDTIAGKSDEHYQGHWLHGVPKSYFLEIEGIKDQNVYADNRPSNVEIPKPQNITIYAYYQGKYLEIPATLQYALNETYEPHSGANSCKNYSGSTSSPFTRTPPWLQITAAVITLIFVIIILYSLSLTILSLTGMVISQRAARSAGNVTRPRNVLFGVLMGILAVFVYADTTFLNRDSLIPFIFLAAAQLFTIVKLNDYIYEWSKNLSDKNYQPSTTWRKLFIGGLITTITIVILYFLMTIALGFFY